ncbi:hypothetical protein HMPREF1522_0849 [Actinomyces sp. ICM54]|uniref:TPM domain-containing protein n=1 Tax=Actinomyces sp. ICM54 TaxID=936549 RepID=UPI000452D5DB|nr:TPM domain-containing protein [Actinomyces sp. ICM54]EWC96344.1 hypothetical protein HMPREF1522_0849 [Actinomyces sp. ICM54]
MSRIRRLGVVAIMMVAMLVGGAPAFATEPLTTSGHVTDPDGFLSDVERAQLESDAESLRSTYGAIIDAVVVPNFSGQEPSVWCQATLEKSRTAEKGILYVVSYEDGTDTYCADAQFARNLTTDPSLKHTFDDARANARNNYTSSPLTSDAVSAGISSFISDIDTASYIHAQVHRHNVTMQQGQDSRDEDDKTRIAIIVIIAGGLLVLTLFLKLRAKLRGQEQDDGRNTRPADLTPLVDPVRREALRASAEARRRLSEAEEQVRAAEEDWNFARAQFGSAAAEQYGRRLEAAKEAIARGLDTHKQIEQTPDSHAKRRLATTITEDLDKNLPPLQDARKEFAAQREKRSSLPTQLADARERLVEELADLERSKEELSSIAGLYPESMLASLQDNPQRAEQLLESARAALETAGAHLDTDATRAASALDTAQRALTMANAQTDAIFSAKTDLDEFRKRLTVSIGSVSAALSDIKQHDSSDAFSPLLDEAEAAIARGQRALVSDEDPLGALENLRDVELRLEAVLAPLMTQEQAKRKAKETAQRHIRDADAALTWARRYLKDHEGSALLDVGKLMSEAEQAMTEAREVLDEDPLRASAAASRATTLTNRALAAPGRR